MSVAAVIKPHHVFGFQSAVNKNINYYEEKVLLYLAGKWFVFHNVDTGEQTFLPVTDPGSITAMVRSEKNLAVASKFKDKARITIYNIKNETRKVINNPSNYKVTEFVSLAFSPLSKYLAGHTGPPDFLLVLWDWETKQVKVTWKPQNVREGADVHHVSFHPLDPDQVVVIGKKFFRHYRWIEDEETLKDHTFMTCEAKGDYYSLAWLPKSNLALGTSDGKILIYEGFDEKMVIDIFDPVAKEFACNPPEVKDDPNIGLDDIPYEKQEISCIITTKKGFVCTFGDRAVLLFEKEEGGGKGFEHKRSIYLPVKINIQSETGETEEYHHKLSHMLLNPAENYLVASTEGGQIFGFSLDIDPLKKTPRQTFDYLYQPLHQGAITGMDVAISETLVVTSTSHTMMLWDYEKLVQEQRKTFRDEIRCLAIHPSGMYLLIGFPDYTTLFAIYLEGLRVVQVFETRDCSAVSFSPSGNVLAMVNLHTIQLYSAITFQRLGNLHGHRHKIVQFLWDINGYHFYSCDVVGLILCWEVAYKKEVWRCTQAGGNVQVTLTPEGTLYIISDDNAIKHIVQGDVAQEVKNESGKLSAVALSHNGHMLFSGTVSGNVRSYRFPFRSAVVDFSEEAAHRGRVEKMRTAFGDEYLLSTGSDGSLCIWKMTDKMDRPRMVVPFADEVLISRRDLLKTLKAVDEMKAEVEGINMTTEFKLQLKDITHANEMRITIDSYEKTIQDLHYYTSKLINEKEYSRHYYEEQKMRMEIDFQKRVFQLESEAVEKLRYEYEMSEKVREEYNKLDECYKKKIQEMEEDRAREIRDLRKTYEPQIEGLQEQIKQERQQFADLRQSYVEIWKQLEAGADMELQELSAKSDMKLQELRGEKARILEEKEEMEKQLKSKEREIEELRSQIRTHLDQKMDLEDIIKKRDKKISDMQTDIGERDETIKDKELIINDQILKLAKLERHKYVLNSCLEGLKSQLVPKDKIIKEREEKIDQLRGYLTINKEIRRKLDIKLSRVHDNVRGFERGYKNAKARARYFQVSLERYRSDLYECSAHIQSPEKLKQSVKKLLAKHSCIGKDVAAEEVSRDEEFARHRNILETAITRLRKQITVFGEISKAQHCKLVQENSELLQSSHELREEYSKLRTRLRNIETALGIKHNQIIDSNFRIREKLDIAVAGVKKREEEMFKEIAEKDRIIKEQQESIRKLQATNVIDKDGTVIEEPQEE